MTTQIRSIDNRKKLLGCNSKDNTEADLALSEEEKKKEITGQVKKDQFELHEAIEKMIVQAKPAGPEPPTPQPQKKKSSEEDRSQ